MTPIDRLAAALKFIHIAPDQNNYDITKVHTIALQEILEAAQAVIAAYSWQPIETAPKDGTEIKGIYENGETDRVRYEETRSCVLGARAGSFGPGWVSIDADNLPVESPVSWMPLPEPPAEGE